MSKIPCLLLAGLLAGANTLAADSPPAAGTGTTTITTTTGADLEAQLQAARYKLEAAARDVAQLSAQLGQSAMTGVQRLRTRAVLGLQLQAEPSRRQGATIISVSPGGPAADAGLATGDVIVALNGAQIRGPDASREVVEHMATVKPDTKVTVKVMRAGQPKEFQVTPHAGFVDYAGVANFFAGVNAADFDGPGPERDPVAKVPMQNLMNVQTRRDGGGVGAVFEGMELADLTPALGQYFGTAQGVLVIRVPRDGEFLKLQDGDVILSIDGRVPENGSHATRILSSYQPGEKIHLKIMRQKKSQELEGMLPEGRHFGRGPGPSGGPEGRPPPQGRLVPLGVDTATEELAALPPG